MCCHWIFYIINTFEILQQLKVIYFILFKPYCTIKLTISSLKSYILYCFVLLSSLSEAWKWLFLCLQILPENFLTDIAWSFSLLSRYLFENFNDIYHDGCCFSILSTIVRFSLIKFLVSPVVMLIFTIFIYFLLILQISHVWGNR